MIDIEEIGVGVDTSGVRTGARDLDAFGKSADSASRKADGLGSSANSASSSITKFGASVVSAYISLRQVQALVNASDAFTKLSAQLKLATDSQRGFNQAYADVQRISQSAQADIAATATLYARLSNALKDVGANQKNIADVTETISLALKINGATAAEAASVMLQLSQAFGSGVLRGEEFNAAMEAAPNLMRGLAESMGIPLGKLREMAREGQITSDILLKAFGNPEYLAKLREQSKEINTIGGAYQNVKNQATLLIGELNEAQGAGWLLARSLEAAAAALSKLREDGGRRVSTSVAGTIPGLQGLGAISEIMSLIKGQDGPSAVGKITKETDQAGASMKALNAELEKFRDANPLKDQAAKLAEFNARIAELAKFEKAGIITAQEAARYRKQFHDELTKGTKTTDDAAKALKELNEAENLYLHKSMDEEKKFVEQEKQRLENLRQQQADAIDAMSREVAGWSDLSEVQRTSWEIQTGRYKDFDAQSKAELLRLAAIVDERRKEEATLKRMADLQAEANKNFESAQKDAQRQHEEFWKSIDSTAHDTFVSIMDGGKSAWKRLKDTAKNIFFDWLYQMTIKKWIINIGATVTGTGVAGTALADGGELAGGGNLGALSTVKSVYDVVKSGFSAANIAFEQGIQQFGSTLVDFGLDTIGGAISQYSALISNVSPFIGAGLALLQGDIKGAVLQGIGAGIGMAIGGPVGGMIGSVLGGAVGGMFGGHVSRPKYYADTQVSADEVKNIKLWGNSDSSSAGNFAKNAAANPGIELGKMVQSLAEQFGGSIQQAFTIGTKYMNKYQSLGIVVGEAVSKTNPEITGIKVDKPEEVAAAYAMTFFSAVKKGFVDIDGYLERFIAASSIDKGNATALLETLAGLKTLHESLAGMPPVFDSLRYAIEHTVTPDTLEQFKAQAAALSQYYQLFYSDTEKLAYGTDALRQRFADIGATMPALTGTAEAMKAQFRALVEGIDQSTDAGRKQFEALINLAPIYAQAADATAQLAGSVTDLGNTAASAADILAQKNDLDRQLMEVMGDQAGLAALDRAKIYDANLAIYDRIQALKAEQSAAAQAAAAAEQAAASLRAIAQERYSLETQLLQEQGKTAELRSRELALLDPSNRALQQQIWALQDQKAAAEAAASAASTMASSASSASDAFRSLADSIVDEVRRLRGEIAGDGSVGFAAAQANFAIATAKARAGDQAAWDALPELSRTLDKLAELNATSLVDLNRLRGNTAASLETTLGKRGYKVPSYDVGTNYVPADTLALVHQGEAIVPRQYNPSAGGADNAELLAEIRRLNERIARMEAHMASTSANSERTARVLDESARGKNSLYTRTTA